MRHLSALSLVVAVAWMPAALGSECHSIKDADQKNRRLAEARTDPTYCYRIRTQELRNACLAQRRGKTAGESSITLFTRRGSVRGRGRLA